MADEHHRLCILQILDTTYGFVSSLSLSILNFRNNQKPFFQKALNESMKEVKEDTLTDIKVVG